MVAVTQQAGKQCGCDAPLHAAARSTPLLPMSPPARPPVPRSLLFFLEDDPDYNLPKRMTADVKDALAQHRDVFEVQGWCGLAAAVPRCQQVQPQCCQTPGDAPSSMLCAVFGDAEDEEQGHDCSQAGCKLSQGGQREGARPWPPGIRRCLPCWGRHSS